MTELRWIDRILGKGKEIEDAPEIERACVLMIPCDIIRPNRAQPRADFSEDELLKLAASIKKYGIIQPLNVRKSEVDDIYDYELITGERRLRAAKLLGLYSVPCLVRDADDEDAATLAIVENVTYQPLNLFEVAYGLKELCEEHGLTQEQIARKTSMSQTAVASKIRLSRLSYDEQCTILELSLSEGHARALLSLPDAQSRTELMYRIFDHDMSVKETEEYIDLLLDGGEIDSLERALLGVSKTSATAIRAIVKKLEALNKSGKDTLISAKSRDDSIELHIRIEK